MRRFTTLLIGALALTNVVAIGGSQTAAASDSPPVPDCTPDPVTAPSTGTGPNSITGVVGVEGGQTIPNVKVIAYDTNWMEWHEDETDADGVFVFDSLNDGDYYVQLTDIGLPPMYYCQQPEEWQANTVSVSGGQHLGDVDLVIAPGEISGTVTTALGANVSGTIYLYDDTEMVVRSGSVIDGDFAVRGLEDGTYRLTVNPLNSVEHWFGGADFWTATTYTVDGTTTQHTANLVLPDGGFSGVLQVGGTAVDYQPLQLTSVATQQRIDFWVEEGGLFNASFLPAGDYRVSGDIDGDPFHSAGVLTTDGTSIENVTVNLPTASIEGTINRGGSPIDGFYESFELSLHALDNDLEFTSSVYTDGSGSFAFRYLPDGDYRLSAYDFNDGGTTWYPGVDDEASAGTITISGGAMEDGTIELPVGLRIEGLLTDTDDNPIGGATVGAWLASWNERFTVNTRPDGTFQLPVEPAVYRLTTQPPSGVKSFWYDGVRDYDSATPIDVSDGTSATGLVIRLQRAGITGQLLDANGVVPWTTVGAEPVGVENSFDDMAYANTDDEGFFAFEFLPAGDYRIWAWSPDTGENSIVGTITSNGTTIEDAGTFSFPDSSISGRVTIGDQTPDESGIGVWVSLVDAFGDECGTQANGDGTYTFEQVPDGDFVVRARAQYDGARDRWYPNVDQQSGASTITVAGADVADIDIDLTAPGRVTGVVRGPDGMPLHTVVALYRGTNPFDGGGWVDSTWTDEITGEFTFLAGDGTYSVSATYDDRSFAPPGTTDPALAESVIVTAGSTEALTIDVPAAATIQGRVTVGGVGKDDVVVLSSGGDPLYGSGDQYLTTTSGGGYYTISGVYDTAFVLKYRPDPSSGLATEYYPGAASYGGADPIAVTPGATIVLDDVELGAPGSISGTVTGIDDNETRAVVRIWDANTSFASSAASQAVVLIEAQDGSYSFDALPEGEYIVSASPWYDELVPFAMTYTGDVIDWDLASTVTVAAGGSAVADIRAQIGRTLTGTVTNTDGDGVAGAVVNASGNGLGGGDDPRVEWRQTYTEADGSYTLTGLAPGDVRLYTGIPGSAPWLLGEYYQDDYTEEDSAGVTVAASGDPQVFDVVLETGIGGTVGWIDDNGPVVLEPSPWTSFGQPVICQAPRLPADGCDQLLNLHLNPMANGQVNLGGLAPGTYNIAAHPLADDTQFTVTPGDRVECQLATRDSSVSSRCTVSAASGATITGTVLDPYGDPRAGVVVTLYDGEYVLAETGGYTVINGTYRIDNVPPGTYQLQFHDPYRMAQTEPSLEEWWSTGGQAYDRTAAIDVVIVGSESIVRDAQLDLPVTGEARLVGDPPSADLFAVACGGYSDFVGWGCNANGEYFPTYYGEVVDGVATFNYVLPGEYSVMIGEWGGTFGGEIISEVGEIDVGPTTTFDCDLPLLGTGTASCTVTPIVIVDDDDGVDSTDEENAPNDGDGNNDGTPDNHQNSVASLPDPSITPDPSAGTTNYVTLSATTTDGGTGTAPAPLRSVSVSQPTTPPPTGVTPQSSLVTFDADVPVGEALTLRVFLPQEADSYWKYDPATGTWTDASSLAVFDDDPTVLNGVTRWGVTLTIVDGGFGDDDGLVNGVVSDPGMFTFTERTPPTVELVGVADGGEFVVGTDLDVTCTTSDPSGVAVHASSSIEPLGQPGYGGVGLYRATCDGAVDALGNEAEPVTATYRLVYGLDADVFTGGSAVASPGINEGKAGRTYPLRWELRDADGTNFNQLPAVTGWTVYDIDCDYLASAGEELPEGTDVVLSGLSVTADGVYKLNYRTDKQTECSLLMINLADGTNLVARFRLR